MGSTRYFSIFGIVFLLGLVLLGCKGEAKIKEVKIGFIGPMTGDYANYGQLQSKAAQLAIDDFNAAEGGIGGQPVKLVVEDSLGKVEKGSAAAQKLINVDKINALVGPVFSGVALAVAADFQNAKIPVIAGSATSAEFTDKGNYIFRTVPSDALQSSILGPYVFQELGFRSLAILYTKNDYSQSLADSVTSSYEKAGGKVLISLGAPEGTKDFRTQLTQIKDMLPDAIFLPNYTAECAQIIKQINEINLEVPILSADGFYNEEIFNLIGEQANGVIFSASPNDTADASFEGRYKEEFGVVPDSFSANIYDGTNILLKAMKATYDAESKSIDSEKLRQAVAGTTGFSGVSGNIEFAPNGDVKKGIAMVAALNGEFHTLGVYRLEGGALSRMR